MQQPPQMIPMVPSFPPTNITTEQIQKYLDENKKLILAIMENQNLGKLAECAQYQALLQKNLMYLAAIADAQPQAPTVNPQMAPHPVMQPPGYFIQHPQAATTAQQPPGVFSSRAPLQFNNPHPLQDPHQQAMQGQMGIRPLGVSNGMHHLQHPESAFGSSGLAAGNAGPSGGNKQGGSDPAPASTSGQGGDRKEEGK